MAHQTITWTILDLSSMDFGGIHLIAILQESLKISIH